jgi:hypothetical protein
MKYKMKYNTRKRKEKMRWCNRWNKRLVKIGDTEIKFVKNVIYLYCINGKL